MSAPRSAVYRALLDAGAIAKWRVPTGMSSRVHEFDAREGGSFSNLAQLRYAELKPAGQRRTPILTTATS